MNRRTQTRIRAAILLSILLVGPAAQASIARTVARSTISPASAAPSPNLRIVGPAGEDPPVVNERKKLKLRVVDGTEAVVPVTEWRTGSPSVAKVTKKGVLKGKLYGFVTVTAVTGRGEAVTTAVVARVTRRHGSMGDGDTKSDSVGRIYLTSPDEQVIYRSDGVRDEIFAGAKGQAGYQDGNGQNARFSHPTGLGIDVSTNGGLYVADTDNHCVRKVGYDGRTSVAVGLPQFSGRVDADVVAADEAVFDSPKGVAAVGSALFVADTRNHALYYLNGSGDTVSLLAGQPGVLGFRNGLFREASFNLPSGLAINTEGNLLAVADTGNDAVRLVRIEPGGSPYLGRVSTAGVASNARRGTPGVGFVFLAPTSVAFDSAQNVCVVDSQGAFVITRAADGTEARVLLAQLGSLGRPASIVVSGTRAIIADADASSPGLAIAVVEVGSPRILTVAPSRIPEALATGSVVIDGENFPPEARVVVDGQVLESVRVESATRIVVDLPEQSRGSRLVSVVTRGGVAQREIDVVPPELDDLAPGEITTYAGSADPVLGDGGRATEASVDLASVSVGEDFGLGGICTDGAGNLYVASPDSHRIRRIDGQSGIITTAVGTGRPEVSGEGLPGTAYGMHSPIASAVGPDGALFVADAGFHRVVRVDPVTTEARTVLGQAGVAGAGVDGEPAGTGFLLSSPRALAFDRAGNLYVSDAGNGRVLQVDSGTRNVRVVAGGGPLDGIPEEGDLATAGNYVVTTLAVSMTGDIVASVRSGPAGQIIRIGSDARVRRVLGGNYVAVNAAGDIYYSFQGPGLVSASISRLYRASGERVSVAGGGRYPDLGDDGPAGEAYFQEGPVAVDGAGNVFLVDLFHDRIRKVDAATGLISTYAGGRNARYSGDGGYRTSATFSVLDDMAWGDGVGLCLADFWNGAVRVIDPNAETVTTRAGGASAYGEPVEGAAALSVRIQPGVVAVTNAAGVLFVDTGDFPLQGDVIWGVDQRSDLRRMAGGGESPSDGIPALDANLGELRDLLETADGHLIFIDALTRRVRRIANSNGPVKTIAGRIHDGFEYSGDGGPALDATLVAPGALALAPGGDLYIADGSRILKVDQSGVISTVAGGVVGVPTDGQLVSEVKFGHISSLAADGAGNVFVADEGNHLVVELDFGTGVVRIVAGIAGEDRNEGDGLQGRDATIAMPGSLVFDRFGNLYVVSRSASSVRVIRKAGSPSRSKQPQP